MSMITALASQSDAFGNGSFTGCAATRRPENGYDVKVHLY
jgi:hypothetical protein